LLDESSETLPVERRAVVVRVNVEPALGNARVEFEHADRARVERAVQGSDCDELVSGVALITALAFGSRATSTADAPASASAPPRPEGSEAAEPVKGAVAPKPAKLVPLAPPPKTRTAPRSRRSANRSPRGPSAARAAGTAPEADELVADEVPAAEDRAGSGLGFEAGAGGWISSWLSPDRTLGADAFARIGQRATGWSARLSLAYGEGSAQVDDRAADFSFLGGRLEGCPVGLVLSKRIRAEPCLAAELGRLHGSGREDSALRTATETSVFWLAAVLAARVRVPLGRWVIVEAQGELGIPVTSHEFVFHDPEASVFTVPPVGGAGRIGVSVPFL
jgi:hypothetical protein